MAVYQAGKSWENKHPGASAGFLVIHGVLNPEQNKELERSKRALEDLLRARFAGYERQILAELPQIQAYNAYLKPFKKTYHVQQQLESVIFKNRPIPSQAALVEAMFMAELESGLLTAGHDLEALQLPISLEASQGGEQYTGMSGKELILKAGDMYIADQVGIISSIVYGPDARTRITSSTSQILFTVYAPPGIEAGSVKAHLENLRDKVFLISPRASVFLLEVCTAY